MENVKFKSDLTNAMVAQQIWSHQTRSVECGEFGANRQRETGKYLNKQHKQGNRLSISFSSHVEHGETKNIQTL
jgi:hypothetical protein